MVPRARRPIDKRLIYVAQTVSNTQDSTQLLAPTFPCTVMGIRWAVSAIGGAATSTVLSYAIVVSRDGDSPNTLGSSDAGDFYTPEQDVLAFGTMLMADSDLSVNLAQNDKGETKSMRKLRVGDTVHMIAKCADAVSVTFKGVVQLFCKT